MGLDLATLHGGCSLLHTLLHPYYSPLLQPLTTAPYLDFALGQAEDELVRPLLGPHDRGHGRGL